MSLILDDLRDSVWKKIEDYTPVGNSHAEVMYQNSREPRLRMILTQRREGTRWTRLYEIQGKLAVHQTVESAIAELVS